MFDIGIWEFLVIGVLALLVFGPEKLPKAAADAGRLLRQLRQGAAAARSELTAAAGLDEGGELSGVISDLRELDPRRIVTDALDGTQEPPTTTGPAAGKPAASPQTRAATGPAAPDPSAGEIDPDWT